MNCERCGFVSESFFNAYFPPAEQMDFVYQDQDSKAFRVVACQDVAEGEKLSKEELDTIEDQLSTQNIGENEIRVDVWFGGDDKYECPKCLKQNVSIQLLSML